MDAERLGGLSRILEVLAAARGTRAPCQAPSFRRQGGSEVADEKSPKRMTDNDLGAGLRHRSKRCEYRQQRPRRSKPSGFGALSPTRHGCRNTRGPHHRGRPGPRRRFVEQTSCWAWRRMHHEFHIGCEKFVRASGFCRKLGLKPGHLLGVEGPVVLILQQKI